MNEFKIHTIPLVFNTVCDFFFGESFEFTFFLCVLFVCPGTRPRLYIYWQKNIYIYSIYNIIK